MISTKLDNKSGISKNQRNVGFCAFNPFKKDFLKLLKVIFLPAFLTSFTDSLINFIDVFLIYNYSHTQNGGHDQLSIINALTSVQALMFVYIASIIGIITGCSVMGAQYFGAKQYNNLKEVLKIRIFYAALLSIIVILPNLIFPKFFVGIVLNSTHANDIAITMTYAVNYLRYMCVSVPFLALSFAVTYTLRDTARNKAAMWISLLVLVARIFTSSFLIYGVGILPRLGLEGSAIGLIVSRVLGLAMLAALCAIMKYEFIIAKSSHFFWSKQVFYKVTKKAVPLLFNELFWSLSIFFNIVAIAFMGEKSLVAFQISASIVELALTIFFALSVTTSTIVGNTLGAGNKELTILRSKQLISIAVLISIAAGFLISILSIFLPQILISNSEPEVILQAKYLILIDAASMVLYGIYGTLFFIIRAGGNAFLAIFDSVLSILINSLLLFILVFWLGDIHHWTVSQIVALLIIANIFRVVFFATIWSRYKWMHILV